MNKNRDMHREINRLAHLTREYLKTTELKVYIPKVYNYQLEVYEV